MYREIADFVDSMGYLPDDCPVEVLKNPDSALAERVRDGARKAANVHPKIDAELEKAKTDLEEVIAGGIKAGAYDFSQAILGIASERVYQTEERGRLPDAGIHAVWKDVNRQYAHTAPERFIPHSWSCEKILGKLAGMLGITEDSEE